MYLHPWNEYKRNMRILIPSKLINFLKAMVQEFLGYPSRNVLQNQLEGQSEQQYGRWTVT